MIFLLIYFGEKIFKDVRLLWLKALYFCISIDCDKIASAVSNYTPS